MAPKASDKKRSRLSDRPSSPLTPGPAAINFFVDWQHAYKHGVGGHSSGSGSGSGSHNRHEHRGRTSKHHKSHSHAKMASRDSSTHPETSSAVTVSDSAATSSGTDSVSMYAVSDDLRFYGPYNGLPVMSIPSHAQYYPGLTSQMHTLLDATTSPLIWDVRQPPTTLTAKSSTSRIFGPNALSFPVVSSGAGHIRIISKDFPWTIEIGPKSRALTATEVLHHLYDLLQCPFDDAVWGAVDDNKREVIERAWKRREENENKIIKNVDWLGKRYIFKGFYKDEKFATKRLIPGAAPVQETWVVSFVKG